MTRLTESFDRMCRAIPNQIDEKIYNFNFPMPTYSNSNMTLLNFLSCNKINYRRAILFIGIALLIPALLGACSNPTPNPVSNINTIKNSKSFIQNNSQDFNLINSILNSQNYVNDGFTQFPFHPNGGLNVSEIDLLMKCLAISTGNVDATYSTPSYIKYFDGASGSQQTQVLVFAPSLITLTDTSSAAELFNKLQTSNGASCIIKQLYDIVDFNFNNKLVLKSDSVNLLPQYSPIEVRISAEGTLIPKVVPVNTYFNFLITQSNRTILMIFSMSSSDSFETLMQQYLNGILAFKIKMP